MRSISPIERKSPRPNKTKEELAKIRNEMMKKKFKDRSKQGSDQGETVTQYSNNYFQPSTKGLDLTTPTCIPKSPSKRRNRLTSPNLTPITNFGRSTSSCRSNLSF